MKIAVIIMVVVLSQNIGLGQTSTKDWKKDLDKYFKEYSKLWAANKMQKLVEDLFASEFVRLSPAPEPGRDVAVTVATYDYLYGQGYETVEWYNISDIIPTGSDGVVGWSKYKFINTHHTTAPIEGKAAFYIIEEGNKLKTRLSMADVQQ